MPLQNFVELMVLLLLFSTKIVWIIAICLLRLYN